MFRPMKRLEAKWNAHTPRYLHNGTKENIIFQLSLTGVILGWFVVRDRLEERQLRKMRSNDDTTDNQK